MRLRMKRLMLVAWFLVVGCGQVRPYTSLITEVERSGRNLWPASDYFVSYDKSIAEMWNNTYAYCIEKMNALANEITLRELAIERNKGWLLTTGGMAGLANTLYTSLAESPKKEWTVSLGLVSGTALLAFLPSLTKDERLSMLRERQNLLFAMQKEVQDKAILFDSSLLLLGYAQQGDDQGEIERLRQDAERKLTELRQSKEETEKLGQDAERKLTELRQSLVRWYQLCSQ